MADDLTPPADPDMLARLALDRWRSARRVELAAAEHALEAGRMLARALAADGGPAAVVAAGWPEGAARALALLARSGATAERVAELGGALRAADALAKAVRDRGAATGEAGGGRVVMRRPVRLDMPRAPLGALLDFAGFASATEGGRPSAVTPRRWRA